MNIKGLDRVVLMVRDIERALAFFSGTLGMQFRELTDDISRRDGVRSYVCHETNLHLISPILPLPPDAAPPMRKRAELLQEHEAIIQAITFKVDDIAATEASMGELGLQIQHRYTPSHDYASIGLDNFAELVSREQDTMGLVLGFANYDAPEPAPPPATDNPMQSTGIDRIVVMVRDMDQALAFFSGKLGLRFRELTPEVQAEAGNRGCVCHEAHLHLVQPSMPLPEGAAPFLKQGAEILKTQEAVVLVLLFGVADPLRAAAETMPAQGFTVLRVWEDDHDYQSVGMDNLNEFIVDAKDTLGIPMGFSQWDPC